MSIPGPIEFIRDVLRNPETGEPFQLYPAQERFLREGLTLGPDGTLPYAELLWSTLKKGGKSTMQAAAGIYVVRVLGGRYAEGYICANDLEQSTGRVFTQMARMVEASPFLRKETRITANKIEFVETGASIQALANDYAGAAGANPTFVGFDELWGYTSERSHRLWDEMVCPVPTRKISVRFTTTYAGFQGESDLLEKLYSRGLQGEEISAALYRQPGMLMFWSHDPVAPWQTPEWLQQMREQLRANAYLRMIENRWVDTDAAFIDMEWWDACVDPEWRPVVADPELPVWVGVDASTKRDQTALVGVTYDRRERRTRLVNHKIFYPTPEAPLDFEGTIVKTLLDWRQRFRIRGVSYDPWQMQPVAQRLRTLGVPMREFPQTVPNLTEASTTLFDLIKGRNIVVYADDEIRRAVSHAVARESPRGWRITKEKAAHKIDVVVALAQAAYTAQHEGASWCSGTGTTSGI